VKQCQLRPQFVEFIPETLEEGILYVSMEYRTTAHLCCCGCGSAVYLPLSPTQWRLTFDGESIWIEPSVGSWTLPCRSHYWIRRNRIQWAEQWTTERVEAARAHDRYSRDRHIASSAPPFGTAAISATPILPPRSRWARFRAFCGLK
jgi:Family of unknown function (DUF6527)